MLKSLMDVNWEEITNLKEFNCLEILNYYEKFSQYHISSSGYGYLNYMLLHEKKSNFEYNTIDNKENKYELLLHRKKLNIYHYCFKIAQNTDLINDYQEKLSNDEKIYLTLLLLNQRIRLSYQQPKIEKTVNLFIKNLLDTKNEYNQLFEINEKQLLHNLTETYFFPIIIKNIDKNLWDSLFSENKWIITKIIQKNDSYKSFSHDPKLLLNTLSLYEKPSLIAIFKNKKLSLFKTFGNKIEFCTGKTLPKQYKKTKARWDHAKNDYLENTMSKEIELILSVMKKENILSTELEDWYEYIMKNNLIKVFEKTAYYLPLNINEINKTELKLLLKEKSSDQIVWEDLLLNIKLQKELEQKPKIKQLKL